MVSKTMDANESSELLTEQELLAMPPSDYMNAAQLEFFRNRLKELEQGIIANAGATTENLRETELVSDPAARAAIEEEHGLELRTRDREYKLLRKVQQAVTRIDRVSTEGAMKPGNRSVLPACGLVRPPT